MLTILRIKKTNFLVDSPLGNYSLHCSTTYAHAGVLRMAYTNLENEDNADAIIFPCSPAFAHPECHLVNNLLSAAIFVLNNLKFLNVNLSTRLIQRPTVYNINS